MQIAFVGAFIFAFIEKAWLPMFISFTALLLVWVPRLIEKKIKHYIPLEFELLLNIFIYASLFLGEIRGFYTRFWWWDIVLHTSSGIAIGFIGFLVMYSLYQREKLNVKPALIAIFSFCFALALGTIWEIFEFWVDSTFGTNMQKSGLVDTMWDLIVDASGALLVSVSGYFYLTKKWKGIGLFDHYVGAYLEKNSSQESQK
jgi:hypothetical protein